MNDAPASRCGEPTRRARLGMAVAMLGLAALIGPTPWLCAHLGLAPTGPGEIGTIIPVGVALVLVAIAVGDLAAAIAPRRSRPPADDVSAG